MGSGDLPPLLFSPIDWSDIMATLTLYKIPDDPRVVIKTLGTAQASIACSPYEEISDLEGSVIVDYNATRYGCNYGYMDGKYFFITGREAATGGRLKLTLRVDVLMTYWDSYKDDTGIVQQNENPDLMNAYMVNPAVKFSEDPKIYSMNIGNPFVYPESDLVICAIGANNLSGIIDPIHL